jgi:hypothetical protein
MNSIKQQGRLVGFLWLLITLTGGFGLMYIRSKILVPGDATATAANIAANEFMFRAAIVGNLLSQIFLFFFGMALFRLFKDIDRTWASVLLISILMTVGLAIVNNLNSFAALIVLSGVDYLKPFSTEQLNAAALFFLRLGNGSGQGLVEIFWTPYFFAFGVLILKSRYLPKLFGFLLMMMSIGFAVNIYTKFLVPQFYPAFFTQLAMALGALGGLPTMFWLLICGAKDQSHIRERGAR